MFDLVNATHHQLNNHQFQSPYITKTHNKYGTLYFMRTDITFGPFVLIDDINYYKKLKKNQKLYHDHVHVTVTWEYVNISIYFDWTRWSRRFINTIYDSLVDEQP